MKRNALIGLALVVAIAIVTSAVPKTTSCEAKEKKPAEDKPHYELVTTATTFALDAGKEGAIVVEIKATDGYEFHKESPLKMTIGEAPGLAFKKLKYGKEDVKDLLKPIFNAPFKAEKPGKYDVSADLHFVVCISTICEIKRPTVKVPIEVK